MATRKKKAASRRSPRTNWRVIVAERDRAITALNHRIEHLEATAQQEAALRARLAVDNNRLRGRDISALIELLILVERKTAGDKVDLGPIAKRCRAALGWPARS